MLPEKKNEFPRGIKEAVLEAIGGKYRNKDCLEKAVEFHHVISNSKVNQKKFPLYLQSPFNCYSICYDCHHNKPLPKKPTELMIQVYEDYLISLQVSPSKLH